MKAVWWLILGGQYSGTRYEGTSACQESRLKIYTWLLIGKYMHLCPHSESMPWTLLLWTTSSKTRAICDPTLQGRQQQSPHPCDVFLDFTSLRDNLPHTP